MAQCPQRARDKENERARDREPDTERKRASERGLTRRLTARARSDGDSFPGSNLRHTCRDLGVGVVWRAPCVLRR